jgi:putative transcriptional regulator
VRENFANDKMTLKEFSAMIRIKLSQKLGKKRMTQSTLARITGIRPSTINDLYHEMAARVGFEQLDKICEALECSLTDILEYTPNRKL